MNVLIGDRVKRRRLELGWTQHQLAVKAGTQACVVSHVETNKRGVSHRVLENIAAALGVSVAFLTGDEEGGAAANGHACNGEAGVLVPQALATFASSEDLSFRATLALLEVQKAIGGGRADWARLHAAVGALIRDGD